MHPHLGARNIEKLDCRIAPEVNNLYSVLNDQGFQIEMYPGIEIFYLMNQTWYLCASSPAVELPGVRLKIN